MDWVEADVALSNDATRIELFCIFLRKHLRSTLLVNFKKLRHYHTLCIVSMVIPVSLFH